MLLQIKHIGECEKVSTWIWTTRLPMPSSKRTLNSLKMNRTNKWLISSAPGILVVGIESPWLDEETVQAINEKWTDGG